MRPVNETHRNCSHTPSPRPVRARLDDDTLDELVWMTTHPAAVVTMSRQTLHVLLDAYGRDCEAEDRALSGMGPG